MNRKHAFTKGEYYHLYNRGIEKRIVFQDAHDYHRFIILLYLCNSATPTDLQSVFRGGLTFAKIFEMAKGDPIVALGAWCLMPNHFHLLVTEVTENGIAKFMQKVTTGYTMYFNKKYERTGALFQGTFRSEYANEDRYLKYLFSYIHLNPVKLISGESKWKEVGIKKMPAAKKFLAGYEYSSYKDYSEKSITKYASLIDKKAFPEYFTNAEEANQEIMEWLNSVEVKPPQN